MEVATFDHLRNGRPVCRNGARTSMKEAKRLKATGYKRGFMRRSQRDLMKL